MNSEELNVNQLNHDDDLFLEKVMIDIRSYMNILKNSSEKRKVLLFPPVNNFRRFLIHQLVEKTFRNSNLNTLSVGKLYARRTVVYSAPLNLTLEKTKNKSNNQSASSPLLQRSNTRAMSNVSDTKTKKSKSRKPDIQIYVPRGRRMLQTWTTESIHIDQDDQQTKAFPEIETHSKSVCDEENYPMTTLYEGENWGVENADICTTKLGGREIDEILVSSDDASVGRSCDIENSRVINLTSDIITNSRVIDLTSDTVTDTRDSNTSNVTDNTKNCVISKSKLENEQSVQDQVHALPSERNSKHDIGESKGNNLFGASASSSGMATTTKFKMNNGSPKASEYDWEELFDDSGDFVDKSLVDELVKNVGKVSIQCAAQDYSPYQTAEERSSNGECIIEVYDFPADFTTDDLSALFAAYRTDQGFQIVWVDDTHALAIFSSPILADEVLNRQLPFVKTRPLKNAIPKSRAKARNYVATPVMRPKTCVSLARRLVSGHLGMKINVTDKQREAEKKLLSDAREKRRQAAKQKIDVWES